MTWHRPEEILQHPECHSDGFTKITRLLVLVEGSTERYSGWWWPTVGNLGHAWMIDGSCEFQKCVAWMPMPQPPEWVGEGKR